MTTPLVVMWSLFYHLSAVTPASLIPAPVCSLQGNFEPDFQADGDLIIGGLFPMHYRVEPPDQNFTYKPAAPQCWGFDPRSFRWAQTMRLAVEEINQSQNMLPNFTLGYKIFDSCATHVAGQRAALAILNGPDLAQSVVCSGTAPVLAVVGDSGTSQSIVVSRTLQPFRSVQQYLQDVVFTLSGEEVDFDAHGDSIPSYDLINWQRGATGNIEFVNVGLYDGAKDIGNELFIKEEAIMWTGHQTKVLVSVCSESCAPGSRMAVRRGAPVCCFDCVPCDDDKVSNENDSVDCTSCPDDYWSNAARTECTPKAIEYLSYDAMGLTLTVIAVVGACLTVAVLGVFLYHRNTPIVKVNNSELSFFILLSLTLCFLCALVFIGEPTSWSCMLRHTAFSIAFSLCISCILGKTLVVLAAFTATRPGNNIMKWLGPKQQRFIISVCTFIQMIICAVWLVTAPPFPNKNTQYDRSRIILECSVGSEQAFWCVLGYIGFLAALCFILAFLARTLPGNFNEAKYITFSMLIFCAVWLAFIPAYVSSPGKFTVAVEIFAILASSFGLLLCLFAQKCYIVVLKPQKNNKQHLMGKVTK
ncbi:extracellular calcium-sensing receptor-like [Conger conger]|uniref:extracellular calcium-sensing receptor-like n=1 Tax=Conger conger TaxID=82655 RepID=UPI002A5AD6DF|nr:extracellular calcium-sensing receptor-like [Conger conger]